MSERPVEILQRIYNAIDTAETGWQAYRSDCMPEFDGAYRRHQNALIATKKALQVRAEQAWQVLSFLLGIGLGAWVPRFLKPVQDATDELTASWVKHTLNHFVGEDINSVIKGTSLDTLKNFAAAGVSDVYEPVVENTMLWNNRFENGIHKRSFQLKQAINQHIDQPGKWTLMQATMLEKAFRSFCPFIVSMPMHSNKQRFGKDAEIEMWAAWALQRDRKWWLENPHHRDLWDMWPITQRLLDLGVNEAVDWHPGKRSATIAGGFIRPGYLLNMNKMIQWAAIRRTRANTCYPIPDPLRLQPAHSALAL